MDIGNFLIFENNTLWLSQIVVFLLSAEITTSDYKIDQ